MNIKNNALLIAGGQVGSQGLSLLRNAMLGHLLSKEDYGIAAIFTIIISLSDILNAGIEKLIIQAKYGDDIEFQETVQTFTIVRGIFSSLIIILLSPYLSLIFSLQTYNIELAFKYLALVPLLKGFVHFDIYRLQRNYNFIPFIASENISQFLSCLMVYPIINNVGDYYSAIYIALVQVFVFTVISRLYSKRKVRFYWFKQYSTFIFRFSIPVIINSLMLLMVYQLDKVVIARFYDLETVAVYSVIFSLTMSAMMVLTKIISSVALPVLSKLQDEKTSFIEKYNNILNYTLLISLFFCVFFILFGDIIITKLFSDKYSGHSMLISIISLTWMFRLIQLPPVLATLALGDTKSSIKVTIVRVVTSVPLVIYFAIKSYTVEYIAYGGVVGEFFSLVFVFLFLNKRYCICSKKITLKLLTTFSLLWLIYLLYPIVI